MSCQCDVVVEVAKLLAEKLSELSEQRGQRGLAIKTINDLYPTDCKYPEVNIIGQNLLARAKRECGIVYNWRDEPTEILVRYAELCREVGGE